MSKIIKFGNIIGKDDGSLEFSNFAIDAGNSTASREVIVLEAVIERLNSELTEVKNRPSSDTVIFTNS